MSTKANPSAGGITSTDIKEMVANTPPSGPKRGIGFIAVVVTLGSFLFGYDTGVIAGALPFMYLPTPAGGLDLSASAEGLVGAFLAIGAAFGAIIGGRISDAKGRRWNILLLAVLFIIGTLGCTFSPNVYVMYVFRFVLGWAVGGASSTVPVYLAETAPQRIRGPLVAVDQFMIVFGQLIAYSLNAVISHAQGGPQVEVASSSADSIAAGEWITWDVAQHHLNEIVISDGNGHAWRWMLVLATIPAILLWLGMRMMPESARWYGYKQQYFEAIGALKRIREEGKDDVVAEMEQIVEVNEAEAAEEKWSLRRAFGTRWTRRILLIGLFVGFFDQLTGINTAMYYLPKILHAAGFPTADAITLNVITGLASAIGAGIGLLLVAKFMRRHVGIYQEAGIVISLSLLALVFAVGISPHMDNNGDIGAGVAAFVPWLVLILVAAFVFIKQSGTVAWILMAELFPSKIRGVGNGFAVGGLWIMNAVVTWAFPVMIAGLGAAWTYAIFALINVFALLFYIFIVPETKNSSLEQIEEQLMKKYS